MATFLFAATPATGHVTPALPLVKALVTAGHEVRFTSGREFEQSVIRTGAEFIPLPEEVDWSGIAPDQRWPERAALEGIKKMQWDIANFFLAPTGTHIAHLKALLAERPADLLVSDPTFAAATILRELGGPPVAFYGINPLILPSRDLPPYGLGMKPMAGPIGALRNRILGAVVRRTVFAPSIGQVDAQRAALGLEPRGRTALESFEEVALFLQLSPPGYEYPRTDLPPYVRFVGHPAPLPPANGFTPPPWWAEVTSGDRPVVVVSQGTVATDLDELVRPAIEGLAHEDVLVIALSAGQDPAVLGPLPANIRTAAYLPFGELFPHASVVVTNGGFGGIQTALRSGVPLVVAGRTEDKPETTARVAWSGTGIDLRTQRPNARRIRNAVREILATPSYAQRARALRDELSHDGLTAEERAVELLEKAAM